MKPHTLLLVALLFSGCASNPSPRDPTDIPSQVDRRKANAAKTAAVLQTSAQIGTYYAVRQNSAHRAYFESAVLVITGLVNDETLDPKNVRAALRGIKVDELNTEEAAMAIAAALTLYQAYFAEEVGDAVGKNDYLRPALIGIRDGIRDGLNAVGTERRFGIPRP